ncbi:unnamed protein product [Haemonchus placei]|uniref:Chitin-binding type-2 domain-containing protein n=1 Tax=Haemonchus placei TaxID=6290 RepID=A0A158QN23_HAEPC|nr:unnamed protein product [Haemonchus placei]
MSNVPFVRPCIATVSPEAGTTPSAAVATTTTVAPAQTPETQQDCSTYCPSVYRDNCNGMPKTFCPTAAQAMDVVRPDGNRCRESWQCPRLSNIYYYTAEDPTDRRRYDDDFVFCFPPPNNFWYLSDETTRIVAVSCESEG